MCRFFIFLKAKGKNMRFIKAKMILDQNGKRSPDVWYVKLSEIDMIIEGRNDHCGFKVESKFFYCEISANQLLEIIHDNT